MRNGRWSSRAFTLIEVLVVLTILGVLMALTAVAVQAAREAARRARCMNNLAGFGRALNTYVSVKGSFPKDARGSGYSFFVELLPHLDQQPLYNSINFFVEPLLMPTTGGNAELTAAVLPFLSCPADSRNAGGARWTNYAGNRSTGVQKYGYNGAFVPQSMSSDMSIFVDGTSQTCAIAEWSLGPAERVAPDRKRSVFATPEALIQPDEFEEFRDACHGLDLGTARLTRRAKGSNWFIAEFGNTLYNHTLPPNDTSCLNRTAVQQGAWTAGSQHPSGVTNVVFVDGHASAIKESISRPVWEALGSRAGREVIGQDAY